MVDAWKCFSPGECPPPDDFDDRGHVHGGCEVELLDHLQFPLQPPQGLNVKHQGLAGVGYLVLHKHHPLHSLVEVGGKLGLGLGATLTNRYHPLVVLERWKVKGTRIV